jgi:hypothetical protein
MLGWNGEFFSAQSTADCAQLIEAVGSTSPDKSPYLHLISEIKILG